MFDSHAHKGDISFQNGLVCTSSPDEAPLGFRFKSIGLLPVSKNEEIDRLEEYAKEGYHIGEIGLDKRYPDIDKQIFLFSRALMIAKKYNRFVSIHIVGYQELAYDLIKESQVDNFLIHGYTGSKEMAERFSSSGGLISINEKAKKTKNFESLLSLPFITETDMPMSAEENKKLSDWNLYLSKILDRDVAHESEERIMERLNG